MNPYIPSKQKGQQFLGDLLMLLHSNMSQCYQKEVEALRVSFNREEKPERKQQTCSEA